MSIKDIIQQQIATALLDVELSEPPKPELGDISVPCFQFAKLFKQNPVQIAAELAPKLNSDVITATATGPYINLTLDPTFVAREVLENQEWLERQGKTIVVDYSSPNIAKHLGIHHLRSTMIGNAICNLHAQLGNKVIRLNYLGDWGTQFGVLLAAFKHYGKALDDQITVDDLVNLYVAYNKEAENNPEMREAARQEFKALEEEARLHDMTYRTSHLVEDMPSSRLEMWKQFRKISLEEFKAIYKRLDVGPYGMIFEGESEFSDAAEKIVDEALEKGVAIESEGAIVIPLGEDKVCMLRKSDGATTYESRDIAAAIAHYNKYEFDEKLYVVGHGQAYHFEQVFTALKLLGYDWADRCKHIPFGLLRFGESKFSSRTGNIVLLKEALDIAKQEVVEKTKENNSEVEDDDLDRIGIGAVVFSDLTNRRIKDSSFRWDDILKFTGSTGPYLQYTTVRCDSIRTKAWSSLTEEEVDEYIPRLERLDTQEEKQILLALADFNAKIIEAATEAEPSILLHYLLRLAKATNHSLHIHRVVQADKELLVTRERLISAVHDTLTQGLNLLGIPVPFKM